MTAKEILNKVGEVLKAQFSEQTPVPAEPVKMMVDVALKDGSMVKVDALEVGATVTKDGLPAPDGEYPTEDGQVIKVVGGLISEMSTPEEMKALPEEMKALPAQVGAMKAQFAAVETSYKAKFAAQEKKIIALKTGFESMLAVVQLMSEQSIAAPKEKVEPASANFKKVLETRGKI